MVDRRRIVERWKQGSARALITLVRTEGSSYRAPGAHLLIDADGEYAGTISGGCLEAEVVRKAAWMVRDGATVKRYSTVFDDTAEIPFGLGCGGVVDLLFEPSNSAECAAFVDAMEASLGGEEMVVATWFPVSGKSLRRAVISVRGEVLFCSSGIRPSDLDSIAGNLSTGIYGDSGVYVERLCPPLRLFVLGAGDDVRPVTTMAALLGWCVTVVDERRQLARRERFPEAESVIAVSSSVDLGVKASDAVVLMTHSYEQDRKLLIDLLGGAEVPGYIGLLGASHRSSLLLSEAAAALGCSVAACCDRVWAPVGLDLGGDGAEAIALAVVAEVQAWQQGKLGGPRRLTAERVAEQIAKGGASLYLQTKCALK